MGRGRSWSAQALADVAAAYVEISTNPVTGVEQKGAVFHKAVYAAFVRRDPDSSAPDGGYAARTQTAVIEKFKVLSADCQKFGKALRLVRASKPTGVSEDGVISMAIAVHLGTSPKLDYCYKDLPHAEWASYRAWLILRAEAKWAGVDNAALQSVPIGGGMDLVDDRSSIEESMIGDVASRAGAEGPIEGQRAGTTARHIVAPLVRTPASKRGAAEATLDERPMGRKAAKNAQTESRGVAAVESLVKTISKGNEVKQARVDLLYFDGSDLDEVDRKCKREYMKLKRNEALLRARGQLAGTEGNCDRSAGDRDTVECGNSSTVLDGGGNSSTVLDGGGNSTTVLDGDE
jgi:hypothetical protein